MHQSLVSRGDGYKHLLESIPMLALHSEDRAEVLVVVFPEDAVFDCLEAVKERLHGDSWERMRMKSS